MHTWIEVVPDLVGLYSILVAKRHLRKLQSVLLHCVDGAGRWMRGVIATPVTDLINCPHDCCGHHQTPERLAQREGMVVHRVSATLHRPTKV